MDTLAQRLAYARQEAGLTQADLAKKAGVSPQTINFVENGRNKGTKHIIAIAKVLGVTATWLDSGKGEMREVSLRPVAVWDKESDLEQHGEYVFLPELNVKPSAGPGAPQWHVDTTGQRQAFTSKWAKRMHINPDCAATMVVSGQSMEPRLLDGDSIVVDYCQNENIINGKAYVLIVEGDTLVKRLFKQPGGGLIVSSDNPNKALFPDIHVTADRMEHVKIIGRVVAVCGGM